MKSDLSLGDLKKQKKVENFYRKRALKEFLIVNFPMKPEIVFLIAFSLLGTQIWFIFWREIQF